MCYILSTGIPDDAYNNLNSKHLAFGVIICYNYSRVFNAEWYVYDDTNLEKSDEETIYRNLKQWNIKFNCAVTEVGRQN